MSTKTRISTFNYVAVSTLVHYHKTSAVDINHTAAVSSAKFSITDFHRTRPELQLQDARLVNYLSCCVMTTMNMYPVCVRGEGVASLHLVSFGVARLVQFRYHFTDIYLRVRLENWDTMRDGSMITFLRTHKICNFKLIFPNPHCFQIPNIQRPTDTEYSTV